LHDFFIIPALAIPRVIPAQAGIQGCPPGFKFTRGMTKKKSRKHMGGTLMVRKKIQKTLAQKEVMW